MKKIGLIVFILALIGGVILANLSSFGRVGSGPFNVSFNFGKVSGSGNVVTQSRDIRDFSSIEVSGVFKVEATAQRDFSVDVQTDDNLMEFITTEVRGGVLYIETEKHLKSSGPIIVRVSAPNFENVEASGVSSISVKDLTNDEFGINANGKSRVSAQGASASLHVGVSGASEIDLADLATETATVDASGASKATVNVSKELSVSASGASKIYYSGTPTVDKSTSGTASVTQK